MGKGLHKVCMDVVNEFNKSLSTLGKSGFVSIILHSRTQ